jgi:hypothetical protein
MRPDEVRSFDSPALIDVADEAQLRAVAEQLDASPEDVAEAVERVGPNLTAVELWLSAPPS